MKILKNLYTVTAAVAKSELNETNFAELLKNAAIEAIMKGRESPEWRAYMSLFADNAAQLTRLTVEEPDEPAYLPHFRAYIVSNAVCGGLTGTRVHLNVDSRIDLDLDDRPDDSVIKPFPIPPV